MRGLLSLTLALLLTLPVLAEKITYRDGSGFVLPGGYEQSSNSVTATGYRSQFRKNKGHQVIKVSLVRYRKYEKARTKFYDIYDKKKGDVKLKKAGGLAFKSVSKEGETVMYKVFAEHGVYTLIFRTADKPDAKFNGDAKRVFKSFKVGKGV